MNRKYEDPSVGRGLRPPTPRIRWNGIWHLGLMSFLRILRFFFKNAGYYAWHKNRWKGSYLTRRQAGRYVKTSELKTNVRFFFRPPTGALVLDYALIRESLPTNAIGYLQYILPEAGWYYQHGEVKVSGPHDTKAHRSTWTSFFIHVTGVKFYFFNPVKKEDSKK